MNKIINANCLDGLKELPEKCVHTCVTSPPYFGLRDYGTAKWDGGDPVCDHKAAKMKSRYDYAMQPGSRHAEMAETTKGTDGAKWASVCPDCGAVKVDEQIGLEPTPQDFVAALVAVFREVKRVLRDDGTVWLNLGDSYCNTNGYARAEKKWQRPGRNDAPANDRTLDALHAAGVKTKDLIGIPWRVAFALQADGWYLRQDIIWHKPNPMPESVTDRCTKSHEYIFLLSKSPKYYFDHKAIAEDCIDNGHASRKKQAKFGGANKHEGYGTRLHSGREYVGTSDNKRNKRDVWTVTTKPCKEAHFATFPTDLIRPCVLAGAPAGGIVLDPFMGAGTTAMVSKQEGRQYVGFELNQEYIAIAESGLRRRIKKKKSSFRC